MSVVLVTGSAGLVGSESVQFFAKKNFDVVGIDNDLRRSFFGKEASTGPMRAFLQKNVRRYQHHTLDIRDFSDLQKVFRKFGRRITLIIHTAAQPSHDWAGREPLTDFGINANGTLNLLELTLRYCPPAVFIFTSTNKVYGDLPNTLPLKESSTRWDLNPSHPCYRGIDEKMSIDQSKHSLFGASKLAADILVQEYGRYFGMKTACFRGGCLTGPNHTGVELHGFLSYLMKCCVGGEKYTIYGYKGKQVRDNIHSYDLVNAFYHFYRRPRPGEVYNIGGGRTNSCSLLEAIDLCEKISGRKLKRSYQKEVRAGDHKWYISSNKKFQSQYPEWKLTYGLEKTLREIYENNYTRWQKEG